MMGGYYSEYKPTKAERFWRWLGYRTRVPAFPEDAPELSGWIMSHIRVQISLADRLRILLSGNVKVRIETRTSARVDHAISASSFEVCRPGSVIE